LQGSWSRVGFGIGVPAAAAQALDSSYTAKFPGHNLTPSCPNGEAACGTGTDPTFGPFTYGTVITPTGQITTLTFTTGTLILDETPYSVTPPGPGAINQPPWAFGHPGTFVQTWTIDPLSSGTFGRATGSGTDPQQAAGIVIHGVFAGTITLP
jgi:hypothetical protein